MTFKDLQRLIGSQSDVNLSSNNPKQILLSRLRDKPFWLWESIAHKQRARVSRGYCCFNHSIGLPRKDNQEKPIFDYEKMLFLALTQPDYLNSITGRPGPAYAFKVKHLWVKKATGLGVTEFMLRFMAWLCLRNDDYRSSQMVIVTGPNQELAIKLIKRMKMLFEPAGITFDSKETVLNLNGCSIEAYPSNHIDSFRSLTNPKFILIDEADFMPKFQQEDIRIVAERYIAKSDPFIVMVSTPNAPGGLFEKIEKEDFKTCIYKKLFLDYTYGLGKIYTAEEIEKAKASPSFSREYELKYQGLIGNTFNTSSIQRATFDSYTPGIFKQNVKTSVGVDAGFGSSKFAVVVTQLFDQKIHVMFADEFERANFNEMIDLVWQLKHKCGHISNIYSDAANPEIIEALKREFGESTDWQYIHDQVAECKKYNLHIEDRMLVVPTPFSVEGRRMLEHTKYLLEENDEDGSGLIRIHPSFEKLLTALRTTVSNEYKLSKDETSYNDILDGFMLSLQFYKRSK